MRKSRKGMTPERAARAAKVVSLYDAGVTFENIAKQLGISRTQARADYDKAMEEARPDTASRVFDKTDRRLNRLYAAWLKQALEGDVKAARIILEVNRQMMDLWGIRGAVRVEMGVNGGNVFSEFLDVIRDDKAVPEE